MKAIILAAGMGNRMRPLTDDAHKTLLEVGGQTVLGRIMDGLVTNGVTSIIVVTGYRAAEVESWVLAHYPAPAVAIEFVRNERFRETNNIVSLSLAFEHLALDASDESILLVESDLVCEPAVFERIVRAPHANTALVDHYRSGMDGTVVTVDEGVITSVLPPHLQKGDFSFAGKCKTLNIYKFSAELCRSFKQLLSHYVRTLDEGCFYELVLGVLIYVNKAVIHAEILHGERWVELDDPDDLRIAEFEFAPHERRRILEETRGGFWSHEGLLDFCFLRNMYFPTTSVLAELRTNLPRLVQNYGSTQDVLERKLAHFLLCNPQHVVALNGASQIYPFLARHSGHRRCLVPTPTFGEYARIFPAHVSYTDGDAAALEAAQLHTEAATADVVVFVNPNNPTGTTLPTAWIHAFAARHAHALVIVDESFLPFCSEPSITTLLAREPLENVLVITSLSKSLGVPGIRLGHVYTCNAALRAAIRHEIPIWNLNSVAEHFLEIVLKHRPELAASYRATMVDRAAFARELEQLPFVDRVHPSGGNFLRVTLRQGAEVGQSIVERLLQRVERPRFYVKDVSSRFAGDRTQLRLAVRIPSENRLLCAALGEKRSA